MQDLFVLHDSFRSGLASAHIMGRCQTVRILPSGAASDSALGGGGCTWGEGGGVAEAVYYMDGAHTIESMENGAAWFSRVGKQVARRRVLVFYCSSERDPEALVGPLEELNREQPFDRVAVCANEMPLIPQGTTSDGWLRKLACSLESRGMPTAELFGSVSGLLDWLEAERATCGSKGVSVYVTGSLLLCGDVLRESIRRGQQPQF